MKSSHQMTVFRGCIPVVDVEYGGESDWSPVEAVIEAIATAASVDPMDLPPLFKFVDTDAINQLFDGHDDGDAHTLLGFEIETWNVFVRSDGKIRICDGTQPTDPEPVFENSVT